MWDESKSDFGWRGGKVECVDGVAACCCRHISGWQNQKLTNGTIHDILLQKELDGNANEMQQM